MDAEEIMDRLECCTARIDILKVLCRNAKYSQSIYEESMYFIKKIIEQLDLIKKGMRDNG